MKSKSPFFLPYQERWIRDNARIKIMEKSRQIGISWAMAYRTVRQALENKKTPVWVSSRDEKQAQLFLQDCKTFANIFQTVAKAKQAAIISSKNQPNAYQMRLSNGNYIHSMSSNPDAQAGKRGTRVLDEFALHPDPEQLYNIAYPGITWGGQLEIISTHRGAKNFFNRLLQEIKQNGNPKKISLHRVTLTDALEQGFLEKLKQKLPKDDPRQDMDEAQYFNFVQSSCASKEAFSQEYMCLPMDENSTFLSYEAIAGCFYDHACWEQLGNGETFLGIDLARDNDLSVFCLVEKIEDVFYTRRLYTLQKASFDEQEQLLNSILTLPSIRHICIDQTGIGRQFAERAQQRSFRVEGVTFTAGLKETLAYGLKSVIERKKLRIPNDPKVIDDLRSVQQIVGHGTYCRFDAEHSANGHADRFWALALAIYAANQCQPESFAAELLTPIRRKSL